MHILEHFAYLDALLVSIGGLLIVDLRFKLAFWYNARRTTWALAGMVGIFVLWDLLGIGFGIFLKGTSQFMLPFVIGPQFPLEELFFLFLLSYVTLLLHRGWATWRRISS